jgi:16S rRNA (cytosine967-C5)-methyltransferase
MRPGALEQRCKDQIEVLDRAAALVKPGGRIAYITCSVLPPENGEQIRGFVARHPEFSVLPPSQTMTVLWDKAEEFADAVLQSAEGLLMTPRRTGTDGFFVSVLKRQA